MVQEGYTQKRNTYRKEIDGLKGVCILAVIFYHFGLLSGGGVDVFFVISGYLITAIITRAREAGTFSLKHFYIKRLRRLLPLLLVANFFVLATGYFFMLPDDLENLSESVVATNFFSNNILLFLTDGNYWALGSKFKPLLHTWTLAIEEQFYLVYPLFLLLFKSRKKMLVSIVLVSAVSLMLFLAQGKSPITYYFPHYRFFELGAGALVSFVTFKSSSYLRVFSFGVLVLLLFSANQMGLSLNYKVVCIVAATVLFLLPAKNTGLIAVLLENRLITYIGAISYGLYIWHQPVLAYARYITGSADGAGKIAVLTAAIFVLAISTYYLVEQPFRNADRVKLKITLGFTGGLLAITTVSALFIYSKSGVVRNIPELDISVAHIERNMHAKFNDAIYKFDKPFTKAHDKKKVLVIGHSFARDWVNVLLLSRYSDSIEVSYIFKPDNSQGVYERVQQADVIYFSPLHKTEFEKLQQKYSIDINRVRITGLKNFGSSSGVFYSRRGTEGYCLQTERLHSKFTLLNEVYKQEWGNKYIDLIALGSNADGTVRVFTPGCKFISQDCKHFTKAGAAYYATLISEPELE